MNTSLTNSTVHGLEILALIMSSSSVLSIHIINFSLGLPLNIYILILMIRAGRLDGSVIFSLNQTVTEILFALQTPLLIIFYVNMTNLHFLKAIMFFTSALMFSRLLFQGSVCFERYLAVVHPITFLKYKSIKYRFMSSVVIWINALLCGILSCIILSNLPFTPLAVLYTIVLFIHLFFCFSILRTLRRQGPGDRERKDGGVNIVKKKAFELVSFNSLSFLFQTLPLIVAFSAMNSLSIDAFNVAFVIYVDISIAAGCFHPILLLHQMDKLTGVKCKTRSTVCIFT